MSRPPRRIVFGGVLFLVAALVTYLVLGRKAPLSVQVLGYSTNPVAGFLVPPSEQAYVSAIIAVTNNSGRAITYLTRGSRVEHWLLAETAEGWKAPGMWMCGNGISDQRLAPGSGFTFEALVPCGQRSKVQLSYANGKTPWPVWQRLPAWLAGRLPWCTPWRTSTSEIIDLREPRT